MKTLPVDHAKAPAEVSEVEARLALARQAFAEYKTHCFWYLKPDLEIDLEALPTIIAGLREYGDRRAFLIAARLCQ